MGNEVMIDEAYANPRNMTKYAGTVDVAVYM